MLVPVKLPTSLQKYANNEKLLQVEASTVQEMIDSLVDRYPGIKNHLLDETNALRRFINIYINSDDIRFLDLTDTQLKDGDEITILTAVAGG